jgi:formylglycine-generating enzyme required for sulfatase activity
MGTPRWLGTGGRATNGDDGARVVRGGHCGSSPADARVAARYVLGPQSYEGANGLRPVRALEH